MIARTFLVDGQPLTAETDRHAVKYYAAVLNRLPGVVEIEGRVRDVFQQCEGTGLGIFCDDAFPEHYNFDDDGVYWLTDAALEALAKADGTEGTKGTKGKGVGHAD
jgi:hypothetical protein